MKKRKWLTGTALLLAAAVVLTVGASAAEPGSSQDPLVTLSYLRDTYWNDLMEQVEARIAQRDKELSAELGTGTSSSGGNTVNGDNFTVVTLSKGQTLTGGIGCEVMLRVGSAVCVAASSPGLIDETTGANLGGGSALVQNHLYMMTVEGRGVRAGAATTKLLVRGSYSIG